MRPRFSQLHGLKKMTLENLYKRQRVLLYLSLQRLYSAHSLWSFQDFEPKWKISIYELSPELVCCPYSIRGDVIMMVCLESWQQALVVTYLIWPPLLAFFIRSQLSGVEMRLGCSFTVLSSDWKWPQVLFSVFLMGCFMGILLGVLMTVMSYNFKSALESQLPVTNLRGSTRSLLSRVVQIFF